jgi:hypothetical protein
VRDELLAFAAEQPQAREATFAWRASGWPRLAEFGARVREQLLHGDGVLRVCGLGELELDVELMRCFYVAFGCALGEPMLPYGRLYPVVDRGVSYKEQAVPVSMTSAETFFHTDSSSVDFVPDFVGLLCEEPSDHGGESLVSNALRVHQILREGSPALLEALYAPKFRDVVTPGREKTRENLLRNRFPIFSQEAGQPEPLFRYMRYWIEVGHEKAGVPLSELALAAMDRLDELLENPDNVVRFRLERGDFVWINNRQLAHNRTDYSDTPGNVRQLQRMWIEARPL